MITEFPNPRNCSVPRSQTITKFNIIETNEIRDLVQKFMQEESIYCGELDRLIQKKVQFAIMFIQILMFRFLSLLCFVLRMKFSKSRSKEKILRNSLKQH